MPRTHELFFVGRNVERRRAPSRSASSTKWSTPDELEATAVELAAEIAANAPLSLKGNKRVIDTLAAIPRADAGAGEAS